MPSASIQILALSFAASFICACIAPAEAKAPVRTRVTCLTTDIDIDPDEVIDACTEAITGGAFGDEAHMARAYYRRGAFRVLDRSDYALALADFNRSIEIAPRFAPAFAARGVAYQRMGDNARALADLNNAIRLDRDRAFAYANRGALHLEQRDYASAIADYDVAIRIDPTNAADIHNRGVAHLGAGSYAQAIGDFDRARQLESRPPDAAYRGVGTYNRAVGDFEATFAARDASLQGFSTQAATLYGRGVAKTRLGQTADGAADIAAAIAEDADVAARFAGYGITPANG